MEERRWTYGPNDTDPKPYGPKTIANIHGGVIFPALAFAATKRSYLDATPAAGIELTPSRGRAVTPDRVPMGDELEQWITIGYAVSALAGDVITLALGTGLRWGELAALRPCDLDLDAGLLAVNQVVKEDEHRRLYLAPYGKTPAAQRTIRLPARVVAMSRRRIGGVAPRALIFTGARGGILASSGGWHQTHWSKVIGRAEEAGTLTAATPHKFRHAHATALLAKNVSLDTVCKRLGHSARDDRSAPLFQGALDETWGLEVLLPTACSRVVAIQSVRSTPTFLAASSQRSTCFFLTRSSSWISWIFSILRSS